MATATAGDITLTLNESEARSVAAALFSLSWTSQDENVSLHIMEAYIALTDQVGHLGLPEIAREWNV
jgi:hypothetical protein